MFRAIRWGLPIVIIYLIVRHLDFSALFQALRQTNPWLAVLGLMHAPVLILIAAYRWKDLLSQYVGRTVPFAGILRHYWIGNALGFFSPASLGLDAYRVAAVGRRLGGYVTNIGIIFIEKLMALITCMTIIAILYPIVPIAVHKDLEQVFQLAYYLLCASLLLVAAIAAILKNRFLSRLLNLLDGWFTRNVYRIRSKLVSEHATTPYPTLSFRQTLEPLIRPRILVVVALSFAIQFVSSVKSQIFFCALGYDLPFVVNLFAAPALYFIFFLPISMGSVGIREGVYVLLYGLFGVPAEIALLVSFFNLAGMLLNSAIGGIIMFLSNMKPVTPEPSSSAIPPEENTQFTRSFN